MAFVIPAPVSLASVFDTLVDVKATKVIGTTYTVGTAARLVVIDVTAGGTGLRVRYGTGDPPSPGSHVFAALGRCNFCFIVPAGGTYALDNLGGTAGTVNTWMECDV